MRKEEFQRMFEQLQKETSVPEVFLRNFFYEIRRKDLGLDPQDLISTEKLNFENVSAEEWPKITREIKVQAHNFLRYLQYNKDIDGQGILSIPDRIRNRNQRYVTWITQRYNVDQLRRNTPDILRQLRTRKEDYLQSRGIHEEQLTAKDWGQICDFSVEKVSKFHDRPLDALLQSLTLSFNKEGGTYTITVGKDKETIPITNSYRASQLMIDLQLNHTLFKAVLTALTQSGRFSFSIQEFSFHPASGTVYNLDLQIQYGQNPSNKVCLHDILNPHDLQMLSEIIELGFAHENFGEWENKTVGDVLREVNLWLTIPFEARIDKSDDESTQLSYYFRTIWGVNEVEIANQHIIMLSLAGFGLDQLPEQVLRLPLLEKLSLADNRFTEIPKSITQLTNLKRLDLSSNHLVEFSTDMQTIFTELSQRVLGAPPPVVYDDEYLSLSLPLAEKRFLVESRIPIAKLIIENQHIVEINHSPSDLKVLPASIGALTELRTLRLDQGSLRKLPAEIGHLSKLESLSLSGNFLVTLPDTIGELDHLQELNLSGNHLETLPDTIGSLTNLRTLNLGDPRVDYDFFTCEGISSNEIDDIFSLMSYDFLSCKCGYSGTNDDVLERVLLQFEQISIGELYRLLSPHMNHLRSIPGTVGNLSNLIELSLVGNWLSTLPDTIGDLSKLEQLDLSGNPLETLPNTMTTLPNLRSLQIHSPISLITDPERCPTEVVDLLDRLRQRGCVVMDTLMERLLIDRYDRLEISRADLEEANAQVKFSHVDKLIFLPDVTQEVFTRYVERVTHCGIVKIPSIFPKPIMYSKFQFCDRIETYDNERD